VFFIVFLFAYKGQFCRFLAGFATCFATSVNPVVAKAPVGELPAGSHACNFLWRAAQVIKQTQ
tara:strand:- start:177 stop:365 length:189 start_codon:yes stop_codon:yes gene_type:complete